VRGELGAAAGADGAEEISRDLGEVALPVCARIELHAQAGCEIVGKPVVLRDEVGEVEVYR
jgi:hypothetical protein